MKWPLSWYVEVRCEPPDAYWAAMTEKHNRECPAVQMHWMKGVLVGPMWWRELIGDKRKPLITRRKEGE